MRIYYYYKEEDEIMAGQKKEEITEKAEIIEKEEIKETEGIINESNQEEWKAFFKYISPYEIEKLEENDGQIVKEFFADKAKVSVLRELYQKCQATMSRIDELLNQFQRTSSLEENSQIVDAIVKEVIAFPNFVVDRLTSMNDRKTPGGDAIYPVLLFSVKKFMTGNIFLFRDILQEGLNFAENNDKASIEMFLNLVEYTCKERNKSIQHLEITSKNTRDLNSTQPLDNYAEQEKAHFNSFKDCAQLSSLEYEELLREQISSINPQLKDSPWGKKLLQLIDQQKKCRSAMNSFFGHYVVGVSLSREFKKNARILQAVYLALHSLNWQELDDPSMQEFLRLNVLCARYENTTLDHENQKAQHLKTEVGKLRRESLLGIRGQSISTSSTSLNNNGSGIIKSRILHFKIKVAFLTKAEEEKKNKEEPLKKVEFSIQRRWERFRKKVESILFTLKQTCNPSIENRASFSWFCNGYDNIVRSSSPLSSQKK